MPIHDDLGTRMKNFYETVPKTKLIRRMPVIIRIDGKAFHTFTRGLKKPFDEILMESMQETTRYLCENIQGSVLGYTQSDEITLVLVDYQKLDSAAWFEYEVQKMCSISASMATMIFNRLFANKVSALKEKGCEDTAYLKTLDRCVNQGAMFDARVFNIPKEEVTNCIYWRQLDAARNSVQMMGQANFSHKELQNKSCSAIQDMLILQKGLNWNDIPTHQKRGTCVIKKESADAEARSQKSNWVIDKEIPLFKGEGRNYIERLIYVGE